VNLAQINLALAREPLDAPLLADFVAWLEPVNVSADAAPGFVWRLQDEAGDATGIRVTDDDRLIVNLSVWESVEALRGWVYGDAGHLAALRRRTEWFERMRVAVALWWIPEGDVPSVQDAVRRLDHLREHGPSDVAFTLQAPLPPPE
jgi:heme-degrading monooxygenase HmoA